MKNLIRISLFFLLFCLLCITAGGASDAVSGTPQEEVIDTIPAAYDLREYGYVTSVKRQGEFGTCWAFAAINAIESNAIMNGYETLTSADFSELNLAYYLYNRTGVTVASVLPELSGLSGDTIKLHDGVNYLEMGGNPFMAAAHLATGMGIVREADAPYSWVENDPSLVLPPEDAMKNTVYLVSNALYSQFENRDEVKQLLMEYGCGAFNHYSVLDDYHSATYNDEPSTTFYQNKKTTTNHAISLVGWDDNYPKENFKTAPKNDGAWLVKNSWSPFWGDEGYFWLSYEDTSLNHVVFYEVRPVDSYDTIYQYDGSSSLEYYSVNTAKDGKFSVSAANTFTAEKEEVLTDIAFMTLNRDVSYTVSVVLEDGTVAATESGVLAYCGYHTIPLSTPVTVSAGEEFDVVVSLSVASSTKDIYGKNRLALPFDASMTTSLADIVSAYKPGDGYLVTSSGEQDGSVLLNGKGGNFRIKAFGKAMEEPEQMPVPDVSGEGSNQNPFAGLIESIMQFFMKLFGA